MSLKASIFFLNVAYLCKMRDKNIFFSKSCIKEHLSTRPTILTHGIGGLFKNKKELFLKSSFFIGFQ